MDPKANPDASDNNQPAGMPPTSPAPDSPVVQDVTPPTSPAAPFGAPSAEPLGGAGESLEPLPQTTVPGAPDVLADTPSPAPAEPVATPPALEPTPEPMPDAIQPAPEPEPALTPPTSEQPAAPAPAAPVHGSAHKSSKLIVWVTVLLGLVLAAVAVYVYLQSTNNAEAAAISNYFVR